MAFTKITDEDLQNKGVIGLPDTPSLSTSEMQAKFEQTAREVIVPMFNQLVDDLSNPSAASQIGTKGKNRTVQGHIDNLENPHNVTAEQVGAYTKGQTEKAISDRISQIGSADMTQAVYDPTHRQQDIFAYSDSQGVHVYTHQKVGTVHRLTGSGACGRVKLTANVAAGDTVQLNGKTVPAYVGGESFADAFAGEALSGRWLSFVWDGSQVNFKSGGGLSVTKLALANAKPDTVLEDTTFYAKGSKSLKTGTRKNRSVVGKNGAVGISQYFPSVPVTPVATNTQINSNLDGVSRLCLQPPDGLYDGNSYVGETFAKVARAIGLTAEKLCAGNTVIDVKGTGVTKAVWNGSIPNDTSTHSLATTPAAGTLLFFFAGNADHDMQIKSIVIGSKVVATPGRNNMYFATFSVSANQNIYMQWDINFGGGTPSGKGVICYV